MDGSAWEAFTRPGAWYRGNLHCHSTASDGARSPDEVAAYYRAQGYHFVALSDHRKVTDISAHAAEDFLPVKALEFDGHDATVGPYHLLAVGLHHMTLQKPGLSLAERIHVTLEDGGLCIFAHPYWLGTCATDLLGLQGCFGLEVYNASCQIEVAKGYAMQCWDDALQRGQRFYGFATDDAHWTQPDYGLGWIMVKAPRLDESALLDAMRRGHFYSSTGPEIEYLGLERGVARVRCSPVDAIHFIAQTTHGRRVVAPSGEAITEARYTLTGQERYLRVECVRREGTRAWSNPIWP